MQAGAKKVYAVEASDMADLARKMVEINNAENVIQVIKGKMEEVELPVDKVDVLISEWIGSFLVFESMIDSMIFARNKYLKKKEEGGCLIPDSANLYLSCVNIDDLYENKISFFENVCGMNMQPLKEIAYNINFVPATSQFFVQAENLISNHVLFASFDLWNISPSFYEYLETRFELTFKRSKTLHGFVLWFDIVFSADGSDKIVLDTSPFCPKTHWKHELMVMEEKDFLEICEGEKVVGIFNLERNKYWRRHYNIEVCYRVSMKGGEIEGEKYSKLFFKSFPKFRYKTDIGAEEANLRSEAARKDDEENAKSN